MCLNVTTHLFFVFYLIPTSQKKMLLVVHSLGSVWH